MFISELYPLPFIAFSDFWVVWRIEIRLKKYFCFRKSVRWKLFYHLPTRIVDVYQNMYFLLKKHTHKQKANETKEGKRKTKETKEEKEKSNVAVVKSISRKSNVCDIDYKFALCVFNLCDRAVNFSWLFVWISRNLHATREITVFVKL